MMKYTVTIALVFLHVLSWAQLKPISGRVKDAGDGTGMPGVNISVNRKPTEVTNPNGEFTLQAAQGDTLIFTLIGKKPVTEVVKARSILEIVMYDDESLLDEVTVV